MQTRFRLVLAGVSAAAVLFARPASAQGEKAASAPSITLPVAEAPHPRRDRNLITAEEMQEQTGANALELVMTLHPQWLRGHGMDSFHRPTSVIVYQDGMRMGGAEALRRITRSSIVEIRFMSGIEAAEHFGMDHGSGAILVTTR
jgi:hypothetical protein